MRFVLAAGAVCLLAGCGGGSSPSSAPSDPPTSAAVTPSSSSSASPPSLSDFGIAPLGQPLTSDLGSITVYSVTTPVPGGEAASIATPGMQFAVADVKLCATNPTSDYNADYFHLKDADDRSYDFFNHQAAARQPNLAKVYSVGGGDCARGWLTFEVTPGAKITAVDYSPFQGNPLAWRVSG